jgi:hypothetical protein
MTTCRPAEVRCELPALGELAGTRLTEGELGAAIHAPEKSRGDSPLPSLPAADGVRVTMGPHPRRPSRGLSRIARPSPSRLRPSSDCRHRIGVQIGHPTLAVSMFSRPTAASPPPPGAGPGRGGRTVVPARHLLVPRELTHARSRPPLFERKNCRSCGAGLTTAAGTNRGDRGNAPVNKIRTYRRDL